MGLIGMTASTLEHSVPEKLFSTSDNPIESISTIKALKIASDQNIPVFTINQQNIVTLLPQLQLAQQVKDDIQHAVNTGKIATVSKSNISYLGWDGCGYMLIDPQTGAGAYLISGGTNGSDTLLPYWSAMWLSYFSIMLLSIALGVIYTSPLGIVMAPIAVSVIQIIISNTIQTIFGRSGGITDLSAITVDGAIMDVIGQILLGYLLRGMPSPFSGVAGPTGDIAFVQYLIAYQVYLVDLVAYFFM